MEKIDYSNRFVEEFFNNTNLKLLDNEGFSSPKQIYFSDSDGYKYALRFRIIIKSIRMGFSFDKFHMSNPFRIENIHLWFSYRDIDLILCEKQYAITAKTKMKFKDSNGYFYSLSFEHIRTNYESGIGFSIVNKGNDYSIENIRLWLHKNNLHLSLCENQKYVGTSDDLLFDCSVCGEKEFPMSWHQFTKGNGCPFCASHRIGKYNNLEYLYPEIAKEWDYSKNKTIPSRVASQGSGGYYWICPKCGHGYPSDCANRVGGKGCPKCCESKGEKKIDSFLRKNGIFYNQHRSIPGCKYIKHLIFDFIIYENCEKTKISFVLEYDGELHYRPYRKKDVEQKHFDAGKKRDAIKNEFCKHNRINILRIPYWEFNNIEKILTKELGL